MNKFYSSVLACAVVMSMAAADVTWNTYSDTWVTVDGLGRNVASADSGITRTDIDTTGIVGMFYYIWHGQEGVEKKDVTKILAANPDTPAWGDYYQYHWGGKPWFNYYVAGDRYIVAKHMQMLMDAGVDFYYFDTTNGSIYEPQVRSVMAEIDRREALGLKVPKLVFTVHSDPTARVKTLYDTFYSDSTYNKYWFYWHGKPLILGPVNDCNLGSVIKDRFTWKNCWAWMGGANPNEWAWLENYPQQPGWTFEADGTTKEIEQLSVSVAQHPISRIGKSYHNGSEPAISKWGVCSETPYGLYFQEQMKQALNVHPKVLMITQWNEWIAMRFPGGSRPGATAAASQDGYFVDVYNQEFCRDLEPSSEPLIRDNYYLLFCSKMREYRGAHAIPVPTVSKTIAINDDFTQWNDNTLEYRDEPGDVMFTSDSAQSKITLARTSNDIIVSKVTKDKDNLYFYVKTVKTISPIAYSKSRWMTLLLNTDCDYSTGWSGYNYMVTNKGDKMVLQYSFANENYWIDVAPVQFYVAGNEMHLSIPKSALKLTGDTDFDFKWVDNTDPANGDVMTFISDGDAAPNGRFNYRYKGSKLQSSSVSDITADNSSFRVVADGTQARFAYNAPGRGNVSIAVYDMTGRCLASINPSASQSEATCAVPKGVFIVKYIINGNKGVRKFVNR